jgi:hypothetical protein
MRSVSRSIQQRLRGTLHGLVVQHVVQKPGVAPGKDVAQPTVVNQVTVSLGNGLVDGVEALGGFDDLQHHQVWGLLREEQQCSRGSGLVAGRHPQFRALPRESLHGGNDDLDR